MILDSMKAARNGKDASEQGAYTLVVDSIPYLAYPGETLILRLFVSGYGMIASPKLHIVLPYGLFEEDRSYLYEGLEQWEAGRPSKFGANKRKLLRDGTYLLGGLEQPGWDGPTWMVDTAPDESPRILTETTLGRSFMELEIRIKKHSLWKYMNEDFRKALKAVKNRLRPGKHAIQFVFTYFDGKQWKSDRVVHDIVLPNWYERNIVWAWFMGIILAALAVVVPVLVAQ